MLQLETIVIIQIETGAAIKNRCSICSLKYGRLKKRFVSFLQWITP